MKFYLAHAVVHDGEHEYGEQFTLTAENEREAGELAKKHLLDVYVDPDYADPDEDVFGEDNQLDPTFKETKQTWGIFLRRMLYPSPHAWAGIPIGGGFWQKVSAMSGHQRLCRAL